MKKDVGMTRGDERDERNAMDAVREDFSVKDDRDEEVLILSIACRNYLVLSISYSVDSQVLLNLFLCT